MSGIRQSWVLLCPVSDIECYDGSTLMVTNRGVTVLLSSPPPSSRPLTVLCVDDNADALLIRKTLLEQAGYLVLSALNAEQALQIFATTPIDVVVSDHLLPGTTGTEMARLMKLAKPGVPILLLSGLIEPPAGIEHTDEFLHKTEGPEKLLEAIAALTSQSTVASGLPAILRKSHLAAHEDYEKCAATMAHEINNPLDALLSLLYLADAEPNLTVKGHRYLTLAREEVSRISQIAYAALHAAQDDERPENTDVPLLLCSVIDLYKPQLESRGMSVVIRCCHAGNLAVYPGPLRQVFSNLLLNAADAMARGGRLQARVSTAHEWSGQQRHGLRVTFADDGCGIATENLYKIFEPFFTTKGSGGSGLGLSLAKDVVLKHGGSIRVRSSMKQGRSGSIFSIFLPAA